MRLWKTKLYLKRGEHLQYTKGKSMIAYFCIILVLSIRNNDCREAARQKRKQADKTV